MDPVVPGPRHTRPLARPRLDAPPSKRFVAAPQRSSAWRWAALAATRRATVARGEAEWVPKKEVLTELAASERPIGDGTIASVNLGVAHVSAPFAKCDRPDLRKLRGASS